MGTSADQSASGAGNGTGGPGSDPAAGAQGDGNGGAGAGLDRTKLNPVLQRMSETEINELMDTMVQTIATKREPAEQRQTIPVPPVREVPPEPKYEELMDPSHPSYNPKAAMADFVTRNYGGLIQDISQRANAGVFGEFRETYHDFKEYEADIRNVMAQTGVTSPSREQINGLYLASKGLRITMKERADREALRTRAPSAPKLDDGPKEEPLEPGEERIARRMFRESADPIKEYRAYVARVDDGDMTMKVPLSGGKKR